MSKHPAIGPHGFLLSLERFLGRSGRVALATALVASSSPVLQACAPLGPEDDSEGAEEGDESLLGGGQTDWAQNEGQRNTDQVSFYGESWHHNTDCNTRAGCQGIDLFIKLRVRPAAYANLDQKRVGVVYRAPGEASPVTVTGTYFTTWDNGDEEWHVKVHLRSWQSVVAFNAWYQDGAGHTYFDDNSGDLHPISVGGTNAAIQQVWNPVGLTVDATGVHGKIALRLADIDYDKDVQMVWTTDGWATANWSGTGEGPNAWHWVQDYGADFEQWEIDVAIEDEGVARFEYAIVYRHGGGEDGSKVYEFWDNNYGYNYKVDAQ